MATDRLSSARDRTGGNRESELPLDSDSTGGRLQSRWMHVRTADSAMRDCDQLGNPYQGDWPLRPLARLNTDEHLRTIFFTPPANRDRKMLSGIQLRNYFDDVLDRLDANRLRNVQLARNLYDSAQCQ